MSHRVHAKSSHRTKTHETPAVDPTESQPKKLEEHEERPENWSKSIGLPVGRRSPNSLTFRGGAVLDKPVIKNIYYGDYYLTTKGKADAQYNDAFSADVMKSKYMSTVAQYGVGKGSFAGSTTLGGRPQTVTEADVVRIVKSQTRPTDDPQTIHTVVLPPGCVLDAGDGTTSQDGLGGFHGSYKGANGKPVYYAVIAYSDQQGNGIDFTGDSKKNVSITESHEWIEAATDPDVNSPIAGKKLGWYNDQLGEIGDEAIDKLPLKQAYGTVDGYAVQKEWSNLDGKFEVTANDPNAPVVPPLGSKITV